MSGHRLPDGEHVSAETGLPSNSIAAPRPWAGFVEAIEVLKIHFGNSYEPNHHDRMGWGFLIAQIGVAAENTPKKRPLKLSESPKLWSATEDAVVGRTRTFAEGDDSRQGGQAWEGAELPCQSIPPSQPAVSFFLEPRNVQIRRIPPIFLGGMSLFTWEND